MNDTENPTIPKVATVTVKKAVDGTQKRKPRSDKGKRRSVQLNHHITVDPRVMQQALAMIKPSQRLVIVDSETVRLVNR